MNYNLRSAPLSDLPDINRRPPNLRAAREYGHRPWRTPNRVAENMRMTLRSLSRVQRTTFCGDQRIPALASKADTLR